MENRNLKSSLKSSLSGLLLSSSLIFTLNSCQPKTDESNCSCKSACKCAKCECVEKCEPTPACPAAEEETYNISTTTEDSVALLKPSEFTATLQYALKNRRSIREFSEKKVSDQQISNLLWAAVGVTREDGRRTAPTARNLQEIDVYLYTEAAIYRYQASSHSLKLVKLGDYRGKAGRNGFYLLAPLALTVVADFEKMSEYDEEGKMMYSGTDAGFVCQNIYLYAAANDMATVTCGNIDRAAIAELLGLTNAKPMLSHPIGYPIEENAK